MQRAAKPTSSLHKVHLDVHVAAECGELINAVAVHERVVVLPAVLHDLAADRFASRVELYVERRAAHEEIGVDSRAGASSSSRFFRLKAAER